MRILITGGCGFLGSNLAAYGGRRGDEVTVLDDFSRVGSRENLDWLRSLGPIQWEEADIRNAGGIQRAIVEYQPEVIVHLAAQVAVTVSVADPKKDFDVNVVGTHNLLEAMRQHCPEALLIFASTNKVYGDLRQYRYAEMETRYECVDRPNGFSEDTPMSFETPYGCSKGSADQYVLDYARTFGLRTLAFRHSSIYGGRQFATRDQGWVAWFCGEAISRASRGSEEPVTISGNGKQVRDILHVDDAVRLYFRAMEGQDTPSGEAFNIGGGRTNSLSLLELLALLEELTGRRLPILCLPSRMGDQKVFIAEIGKARRAFEWEPSVTVRDGVRNTLEWVEASLGAESRK